MDNSTMRTTAAANAGREGWQERDKAVAAVRAIADAIVEAVGVAGKAGAPSGHVYAALMSVGISYDQYCSFIRALIASGKIRQAGNLLFAVQP
jgi:hypothetical protein